MKNKVLIFDFDGTIADTFLFFLNISNKLSKRFHFKKISPDEAQMLKNMTLMEIINYLNIPIIQIPLMIAMARNDLNQMIAEVNPIVGIRGHLHHLRSLPYKMGIMTTNSSKNVRAFLKKHDLEIFDFISTSSMIWGKNIKIKKIIKNNDITLDKILYIGDEIRDIEAAKKAKIKIIAVTWGYNSSKALKAYQPDYLITNPKELYQICKNF